MRVQITSHPFGQYDRAALDRLADAGVDVRLNPFHRTLTEAELAALVADVDVLIAGTEPITPRVLHAATQLRLVTRVGIGLDNIDVAAARARGVEVSYTPDAPAPAVAELTLGLILALLRHVAPADRAMRTGEWRRFLGRRLDGLTVGVVGVGRVGRRVATMIAHAFPGVRFLANDLAPDASVAADCGIRWVAKDDLYRDADVVTLHVPLTALTRHLIGARELGLMKPRALLVNTARGALVDEAALAAALGDGRLEGAALDVYEREPYAGPLAGLDRALLTCHMGSMTEDCRAQMEAEAVDDVIRFARGMAIRQPAPEGVI